MSAIKSCCGLIRAELTAKADQDSEALEEQFKNGDMTVENFVKSHRQARCLYHTREQIRSNSEHKIRAYGN